MLPNGPDLVCTMVAIWQAGGVYVPVNPRLPQAEIDHVLADTAPALLVTEAGIGRVDGERRPYPDDVAFVIWTSGTTGRPKPILHTHTALPRAARPGARPAARPLRAATRPAARSPNLIPVSMALNAGIYNSMFGLRAGAALVIMDRFEPHAFAELVGRFGIRSTVLPPAAMAMLTDSDVTDLAPLRYVRSITAPLSPLQAQRFVAKFGDVTSSTATARPRWARSSAGPPPTPRPTPRRSAPPAARTTGVRASGSTTTATCWCARRTPRWASTSAA